MLGFAYLKPDSWLEFSLHPEGPATGQHDQVFPWFSSILEQMLSWCPNFHVALHASQAALSMVTSKFCHHIASTPLARNFSLMQPFQCYIKINSDHMRYLYKGISGHYLGTLKTVDIVSYTPPPPPM
jgi:hypothetical protein